MHIRRTRLDAGADNLDPNSAGYLAMAEAVPLESLATGCRH
ncbi:hypothetical protein [Nocardia sp. NPDC051833]